MEQVETRELVDGYLKAFESRDIESCLGFFDSDARVEWMMGTYSGRESIEEWHKDRFAAGLKILKVNGVNVQDSVVTLDVTVTSKRLSAWRMPSLGGRVTVELENGKIHRTKFAAKSINPQQNWS